VGSGPGSQTTDLYYNGEGARLKQATAGVATTYTLDLAAPLVQVLVLESGGQTTRYVYGVARVSEHRGSSDLSTK
jgi:hypothetical protein